MRVFRMSYMRFQTSDGNTYKSADRRVSKWSTWHVWSSFCFLPQYSEMLEMGFVKLLDGFLTFCSPVLVNWINLLNRLFSACPSTWDMFFQHFCFPHETDCKWGCLQFYCFLKRFHRQQFYPHFKNHIYISSLSIPFMNYQVTLHYYRPQVKGPVRMISLIAVYNCLHVSFTPVAMC